MPLVFQRFRYRVIPLLLGAVLVICGYFVVPLDLTSSTEFSPTLAVTGEQMVDMEGFWGKMLIGSILMIVGAILTLAYSYLEIYSSVTEWGKFSWIWNVARIAFALLAAITAFQVGGASLVWLAVGVVVVLLIIGSYYMLVGKGFSRY